MFMYTWFSERFLLNVEKSVSGGRNENNTHSPALEPMGPGVWKGQMRLGGERRASGRSCTGGSQVCLPQRHSQQCHTEGRASLHFCTLYTWGKFPVVALNSGLRFPDTRMYTHLSYRHHVEQALSSHGLQASMVWVLDQMHVVCFVYKYWMSRPSGGVPQRQAVLTPSQKP